MCICAQDSLLSNAEKTSGTQSETDDTTNRANTPRTPSKMFVNPVDESQKALVYKNRVAYSLPVLLGHWNDEFALKEEQQRVTAYKQKNCQLVVQKLQKICSNLLATTELAKEGPYVLYGENYQIQACDAPSSLKPVHNPTYGLYLAGVVSAHDIEYHQHFVHGSALTASPDRMPCVRNTFVFTACDADKNGQTVYYGDDFFLRIYQSGIEFPLYLQCECHTMYTFGTHLSVRLSQCPDIYCKFKVLHWKPSQRNETLGSAFSPNERVIIKHTASGQNLAVEPSRWVSTFFGPECSISCNTFQDTHRMETGENMWKIISKRNTDVNAYVRAAKGEDVSADMLN